MRVLTNEYVRVKPVKRGKGSMWGGERGNGSESPGIASGDANATNSDIFSNQCKMVTSAR